MRTILVLNPKGGTGKTTMSVNIAAHFAAHGRRVALLDCDPQNSALDWLERRPPGRPTIHGIDASGGRARVPRNTEIAILDAPAGSHGSALSDLLRRTQTAVIPVVPSSVDLAAARRFIAELVEIGRVLRNRVRVATVANRVRERSPGRFEPEAFLRSMRLPDGRRLPFVAMLRNSQNYIHAAERGLGIHELAPSRVFHDVELWEPLVRWLASKRSLPG